MEAGERIQQLLGVISYARRHPGAPVGEVARAVGAGEAEVRRAIDQLSLCGKPPFSPDDLIEIWIDGDDRVHVELDQALGRPLKLTRRESIALEVALRSLGGEVAGAVLRKLEPALGSDGELARRIAVESDDRGLDERFRAISDGLHQRRAVEIVYFTPARGETSTRRLSPYGLIQLTGAWYAVGHDSLRGEVRIFKLERVREARLTDERFVPPADFDARRYADANLFVGAPLGTARIRFERRFVPAVADEWGDARVRDDVLTLDLLQPDWLAAWVLSFGDGAEVLEPDSLRELVRARARDTLKHYR
jgi:proteasome accessory factor C